MHDGLKLNLLQKLVDPFAGSMVFVFGRPKGRFYTVSYQLTDFHQRNLGQHAGKQQEIVGNACG